MLPRVECGGSCLSRHNGTCDRSAKRNWGNVNARVESFF
jgi:hypothetical protein